MGRFANGMMGDCYEADNCNSCWHGADKEKGCPVWLLHLLWNYDQKDGDDKTLALETFIPTTGAPLWNKKCTMFIPKELTEEEERLAKIIISYQKEISRLKSE